LQPQPARVLAHLLERPGEIVSRDDLRRHVWGSETFVAPYTFLCSPPQSPGWRRRAPRRMNVEED
jgi:hypothetical protein